MNDAPWVVIRDSLAGGATLVGSLDITLGEKRVLFLLVRLSRLYSNTISEVEILIVVISVISIHHCYLYLSFEINTNKH